MAVTWTEQEVDFLKENYTKHGAEYCTLSLDRTIVAINKKAQKLCIPGRGKTKTTEKYSKELPSGYELLEDYINSSTSILHRHMGCGFEWFVRPGDILQGTRCPRCAYNGLKTTEKYREEISQEYCILEPYINNRTPILHKHIICEHEWLVAPTSILSGNGCPRCANHGFSKDKPAILYFVKINEQLYKLGVTNRTTKERFASDWNKFNIEILWELKFNNGKIAYVLEQNLLRAYKYLLINTSLLISGNTETLSEEIQCPV